MAGMIRAVVKDAAVRVVFAVAVLAALVLEVAAIAWLAVTGLVLRLTRPGR